MPEFLKPKYKAAMYLRLSRDDGDKAESESISNKCSLILDFAEKYENIQANAKSETFYS